MHKLLANKYFIFYIPGSMGSLLSVLIRSQIEKNFNFHGFADATAHRYVINTFAKTHLYRDYLNFKKTNLSLEQHLIKNLEDNDSIFQTCHIPWCEEFSKKFSKNKNINCIIAYINDPKLKMDMYYCKLKDILLCTFENKNYTVNSTHKNYEEILFIDSLTWYMNQEIKYLKQFPSIDMQTIIQKKDYSMLKKFCKLTDINKLDAIIDDYNANQIIPSNKFDKFPSFIKRYFKKHHPDLDK